MRGFAIRTLCVVGLLVGLSAVASAQGRAGCQAMTGEWAYTKTGTLLPPTGPIPYAAVGKFTVDPGGNISGSQDSSTGGTVVKNALIGTGTQETDCSVTATIGVYDQTGTILLRTAAMVWVVDDNGREARGIVTQLTLGNGAVVPQVITAVSRRVARR